MADDHAVVGFLESNRHEFLICENATVCVWYLALYIINYFFFFSFVMRLFSVTTTVPVGLVLTPWCWYTLFSLFYLELHCAVGNLKQPKGHLSVQNQNPADSNIPVLVCHIKAQNSITPTGQVEHVHQ